jgi:hypothetical protein
MSSIYRDSTACARQALPNYAVLDQGGALRAPRAGASARPLPWEARPGARRPQPQLATDQQRSACVHRGVLRIAVSGWEQFLAASE